MSRNLFISLLYFSLLLLFLGTATGGCRRSEESSWASKNRQVVKLGLLRIEDSLPFFAAEHDGLLKDEDVEVELIIFNSARERDIALEAGEIQGELADLLAAAFIRKIACSWMNPFPRLTPLPVNNCGKPC